MKTCAMCKKQKSWDDFGKRAASSDGRQSYCKPCRKQYDMARKTTSKIVVESKQCRLCGSVKPSSDFYVNKRHRDGLSQDCKECAKRLSSKKYANNPEYLKSWIAENAQRYRANSRRGTQVRRARKEGAFVPGAFIPSVEELVELYGKACLYPGCRNIDATMDHVVPLSKGGKHEFSNLQPLCRSHNSSKRTSVVDYRWGEMSLI